MRFLVVALLPAAVAFPFAACGGKVSTQTTSSSSSSGVSSSTSSSSTTSSTSSSSGGAVGDCQTDADCGGKPCIPLTPGGYLICQDIPAEATTCHPQGQMDECCKTSDCKAGACYDSKNLPFCGGAQQLINRCMVDECQSDQDCGAHSNPSQICAPAGAFGWPVKRCTIVYCKTDADCTVQAGGHCEPIDNICCSTPQGVACVYPGGCKNDKACGSNGSQHCGIDTQAGTAVCMPGPIGCPP